MGRDPLGRRRAGLDRGPDRRQEANDDARRRARVSLAAAGRRRLRRHGPDGRRPTKPRGVPVRTATVRAARPRRRRCVLTGTLRPRAQVQVVAEVAARLLRVAAATRARACAQGEVLAVLDATDYRLAHERATAALAVAEANRAHAEAEKERADNLLKTGGITDKDRLAAQVGLQVAEASLAQARAEAAIAGAAARARARCARPSPAAWRKRHGGRRARMLAAGTPLFTLVDDAVLEFRAARALGRLRQGAAWARRCDVTVDALPGRPSQGAWRAWRRWSTSARARSRWWCEVPGQRPAWWAACSRAPRVRVGQVPGALVVPPARARARRQPTRRRPQAFVVDGRQGGAAHGRPWASKSADAVQVTSGLAAGDAGRARSAGRPRRPARPSRSRRRGK